MLVIEPTNGRELTRWADINGSAVDANVRRLQGRIYRAAANGEKAKVKNLQKLLVRSLSAKLRAIRQVTQENRGHGVYTMTANIWTHSVRSRSDYGRVHG